MAPLLTLREAAALVGVSTSRLRQAALAGDLGHVRFGHRGRIFVAESDVWAWLGQHTRPSRRQTIADAPVLMTVEQLLPPRRRFS